MNEEEEDGYYVVAGPDTMRDPTPLELAELISLQGAMEFTHMMAVMLDRDIMADEETKMIANSAAEQTSHMVEHWWENLLKPEFR